MTDAMPPELETTIRVDNLLDGQELRVLRSAADFILVQVLVRNSQYCACDSTLHVDIVS